MPDYSWGGFKNGQIPSSAMAIIPGTAQFIKKDLLPGVAALRAAFRAKFGYDLEIVEAYRSLPVQQSLYSGWLKKQAGVPGYESYNLAALPGTSMHGWGLSIDFGSRVNVYGSAEKQWTDANAPRFGFTPTGNTFSPREAWHFDGITTTTAGGSAIPILEDDMPDMNEFLNTPAFDGGPTISEMFKEIHNVWAGLYVGGPSVPGGGPLVKLIDGIPARVWATPVSRGGVNVPALQELADAKTAAIDAKLNTKK